MPPRQPPKPYKSKNGDWGGYGSKQGYKDAIKSGKVKMETMAGGNLKSLLTSAATRLATPIRNTARTIGSWAAEASDEVGTYVAKGARTTKVSGDVYTPKGVFQGKDVFISKPAVSAQKAAAVQKGLQTRAANIRAGQVRTGARASVVAGTAGAIGGAVAATEGVRVVKENIQTVKKVVKKARGGGKNKK